MINLTCSILPDRIKWVSSLASYFISIQIRGCRCHPRMMLQVMHDRSNKARTAIFASKRNTMHIHWICLLQITTSMQHMLTQELDIIVSALHCLLFAQCTNYKQ
eukprot:744783_1